MTAGDPSASGEQSGQAPVIAFLSEPAAYGADVDQVSRIDTHGAIVFLAGTRAYKMKRAVRYPYMDYGTLARRRAMCEREIALNRRTAPELYLAATPVVRTAAGGLAIGGDGEPVEWLVVMRRFEQEALGSHLAEAGGWTLPLLERTADAIAAFHEAAEVDEAARRAGDGAARLGAVIAENLEELRERPDIFAPSDIERLADDSDSALAALAPLLDQRAAAGLVRHCHGDLHLRNICVIDGAPRLFDAIEFNDAIACIDVLYDLAFLLMDFYRRGLAAEGNAVFNRYLLRRDDLEGLRALPLFLATRAAVRAKVSVSMAAHASEGDERDALHRDARAYLEAALRYLEPRPPCLVAIGGLSGTGKTTLARRLAPALGAAPGAVHLRSDTLRKLLAGADPLARLPASAYTRETSAQVYAELGDRAGRALRAGAAVVVDAVFAAPAERAAIAREARAADVPFLGLWLDAPGETLCDRVASRRHDASDATASVVRTQLGYDVGRIDWARIDAGGGAEETYAAALRKLARAGLLQAASR